MQDENVPSYVTTVLSDVSYKNYTSECANQYFDRLQ